MSERVVVSCPWKLHSYRVVLSLQEAGMLTKFITGIYFKPNDLTYRLMNLLPASYKESALRELKKRRLEDLREDNIISIPFFEVPSKITSRLPFLNGEFSQRLLITGNWMHDLYVSNWLNRSDPKPSAVYCFESSALLTFQAAKRLGIVTILDMPIIANATHVVEREASLLGLDSMYTRLGKPIREHLWKELLLADRIIAPSEAVAESVVNCGIPREKVDLVPFGVDIRQFNPHGANATPDSRRKFRVLFVGKFDLRKGVHYLLSAWRQLNLPDGELMVVGPAGEFDYVRKMRAEYGDCFIERGNVPHYEVHQLFASADVFVFPSLAEGSALVTYEALASGLPCIVTNEAGSVVRDGVEGFVVPARDATALASRIKRLYDNPELGRRMALAARKRAEEFTWAHYGTRLAKCVATATAESSLAT